MKRRLGCLALALSASLMLAACGSGGATAGTTAAGATTAAAAAGETKAAETTATEAQGPPTELTIAFLITGSAPADQAAVEAEINKITQAKINATVKLLPVNFGAAMQQYNLMLSSNEKLDLLMTFPYTYASLVAQNRVQEIGGLIDQYAPDVKTALGGYYNNGLMNGKIYGVSPITEGAGGGGLVFRKDILEKYKIDPASLTSLDAIESAFATIKAAEPDAALMGFSNQNMGLAETYFGLIGVDKLGDMFGVLEDSQQLKVTNLFASQQYADFVNRMHDWYQKGYIMQDIATSKEDQHSLIKAGKVYGYFTPTKPGIAQQESAQNGYECVVPEFAKPFASTNPLFLWVVPNACEAPDKAVQMLNLMYTDADLENLLSWGIEGKHYEKQSDGTIGFPAGVTDQTSGYFLNTPWMMGNEFLTHVWTGNSPKLWEETKTFRESATVSKAMGFAYDSTSVKNEVTELNNVFGQYKMALEGGAVDPAKVLPEFIEKLNKAGIDKVVAEKQKQLDAWATQNNVK